ncbi:MAG: PBP1A family penicillin-binding protein [Armatimonadetes bacterium]|nr:PBP1A family penicillin-binding protein [Armatimonadota bacterium]MDW8121426.1 PBP1A family penicillin-binding protein [Armatimonadota bacterium]
MNRKLRRWLGWFLIGWLIGNLLLVALAVGVLQRLSRDLPDLGDPASLRKSHITYFYSAEGLPIGSAVSVYRKWVPLSKIPRHLQVATIVAEDRKFYSHPGIDLKGIIRALWACIREWRYVQGASTITMQLARNLYLSPEKTIQRKLKELILAIQLERRFSKEELLELYLNTVCYGHGAYGVQAAAELYFGKDAENLNLPQSALLAALPKRPSYLSPFVNPTAAAQRRNYILSKMAELGYISPSQAKEAIATPVTDGLRSAPTWMTGPTRFLHFLEWTKKELSQRFGPELVNRGGLKVYTTINARLQEQIEQLMEQFIERHQRQGINQAALILIELPSGYIRALYGGRPWRKDPNTGRLIPDYFNRATQAYRQPGSSFKPYVYAAALEAGLQPETVFSDSRIAFRVGRRSWSPQNYDGVYGRRMTLLTALAQSNNVIAVKTMQSVGADKVIEVAQRMGIRFRQDPRLAGYSLALGSVGVTLLDHTAAVATVATGGQRILPTTIKAVYGSDGQLIYRHRQETQPVLDPTVATKLRMMLRAVVTSGTGRRAQVEGYEVAGKTGTSEKIRDVWFVGFTPSLACGVWAGHEDFKPLRYGSGGTWCAPLFRTAVSLALKVYPGRRSFTDEEPNGRPALRKPSTEADEQRVAVTVCTETGLLANRFCPLTHTETLEEPQVPKRRCLIHSQEGETLLICTLSGKRATSQCPTQSVVGAIFPRGEAPTEECDIHSAEQEVHSEPSLPEPSSTNLSSETP